jgi:hypothetical protein
VKTIPQSKDIVATLKGSGYGHAAKLSAVLAGLHLDAATVEAAKEWLAADAAIMADLDVARETFDGSRGKALVTRVARGPMDHEGRPALVEELTNTAGRDQFAKVKSAFRESRVALVKSASVTLDAVGKAASSHLRNTLLASWDVDVSSCTAVGIPASPSPWTLAVGQALRIVEEQHAVAVHRVAPSPDAAKALLAVCGIT